MLDAQQVRLRENPDFKPRAIGADAGPARILAVLDKLLKEEAKKGLLQTHEFQMPGIHPVQTNPRAADAEHLDSSARFNQHLERTKRRIAVTALLSTVRGILRRCPLLPAQS